MSDVSINVNVKGNYKTELKNVNNELQGVAKSTTNWKSVLTTAGVALGVVTAGLAATKKAFDFAKQGAELDLSITKFNRLSNTIGTIADALLKDLKTATRGTVSDMELMASAGDFMALGLAKSHDEVVRLTRVAGALGMNMNQLTLTLTNKTTMRFDAIGVSVDGFAEKVKKLEAAGLSADAAFKEAFLQQAEDQIQKVGDVADTSAGAFMEFEAGINDLTSSFKRWLAEGLLPVIRELNEEMEQSRRSKDAEQEMQDMIDKGIITYEQYASTIADYTEYNKTAEDQLQELKSGTAEYSIELARANRMVEEGRDSVQLFTGDMYDLADQTVKAKHKYQEFADAVNNIDLGMEGKFAALSDAINAALIPNADALQQLYAIITENLADIPPEFAAALSQAGEAGAIALDYALEKIDTKEATKKLMELGLGPEEAAAILADVMGYLQKIAGMVVTATVVVVTQNVSTRTFTLPNGATVTAPRQFGGHVMAGRSYIVGDAPGGKPELFTPSTGGNITSNKDLLSAMSNADILEGINSLRASFETGLLDLGQTLIRVLT